MSRLKEYSHKKRDFNLSGIPITGFSEIELLEYEKLFNSKKNTIYTIKKRVERDCFHYQFCYFLTITFNDAALTRTSINYRRDQIGRFLKANFCTYIANIDFGDKKGREHYHALCFNDIPLREEKFDNYSNIVKCPDLHFSFGFIEVRKVILYDDDKTRISKYMTKLKLHSTKLSTHFVKPIYSRRKVCYEN